MSICICTVVVGEKVEQYSRYTIPSMRQYAKRVGATFVIIRKSNLSKTFYKASYEKFRIKDLLESHERVLFLDADVLVLPQAINVFDQVPDNFLGVTKVGRRLPGINQERKSISAIFNYSIDPENYFNSGVMLASKKHAQLFDYNHFDVVRWAVARKNRVVKAYNDQSVLNYRAQTLGLDLFNLGSAFNFTRVWGEFHTRFAQNFIHYAGIRQQREIWLSEDCNLISNSVKYFLFSRFSLLSRIRDHYLQSKGIELTRRK